MSIHITHEHYDVLTHSTEHGLGEDRVDRAWVERFLGAKDFMESVGGIELHHQSGDGTIVVTAVSPDRATIRATVFVPVGEEG